MDSLAIGAVSIVIGENRHLGGHNSTDFSLVGTLSKATVELDETAVVKNGRHLI